MSIVHSRHSRQPRPLQHLQPLVPLLGWLLLGGWCAPEASAAAQADADPEVAALMDGTWEFNTVGTTAGMSTTPQSFTQVRRVHFHDGGFEPNPLGFTAQGFRLTACESQGPVAFATPYSIGGGTYDMTFTGMGDVNLTHLTGTFTFCMASGTFTAIHEAAEARQTLITLPFGTTTTCPISLTLRPDGPVTVAITRTHGDSHLALTPQLLTFTPETWDQSQLVTLDATALTRPGHVLLAIAGPGVPTTAVAINVVRPGVAHP